MQIFINKHIIACFHLTFISVWIIKSIIPQLSEKTIKDLFIYSSLSDHFKMSVKYEFNCSKQSHYMLFN